MMTTRTFDRINRRMRPAFAAVALGSVLLAGGAAWAADTVLQSTESTQTASAAMPAATGSSVPGVIHVPTLQDIRTPAPANDLAPPLEISATEAQQWVLDAGYSSVSPLEPARTADGAPVYHGTATANGEIYAVIVDSWGNIAGWR